MVSNKLWIRLRLQSENCLFNSPHLLTEPNRGISPIRSLVSIITTVAPTATLNACGQVIIGAYHELQIAVPCDQQGNNGDSVLSQSITNGYQTCTHLADSTGACKALWLCTYSWRTGQNMTERPVLSVFVTIVTAEFIDLWKRSPLYGSRTSHVYVSCRDSLCNCWAVSSFSFVEIVSQI